MFLRRTLVVFYSFFISSFSLSSFAQTLESKALDLQIEAERILSERASTQAAELQATIDIQFKGSIAERIKEAPCAQPNVQFNSKAKPFGKTSVIIFCQQSPWNVSIPVQVSLLADIPIASKNLRRGDSVEQGDWVISTVDLTDWPNGVARSPNELLQSQLGSAVKAGNPFPLPTSTRTSNPRNQRAINSGEVVDIIIQGNGFSIQGRGTAMQGATIGGSIRVKTDGKGNIVTGTVISEGRVEVILK